MMYIYGKISWLICKCLLSALKGDRVVASLICNGWEFHSLEADVEKELFNAGRCVMEVNDFKFKDNMSEDL